MVFLNVSGIKPAQGKRKPLKNSIFPNTMRSKTIWKMPDNGICPLKKVSKLCLQLPFRIINSNGNFDLKTLRRQSWIRNQILKSLLKRSSVYRHHSHTPPRLALDLDHKFTAEAQLNLKRHTCTATVKSRAHMYVPGLSQVSLVT